MKNKFYLWVANPVNTSAEAELEHLMHELSHHFMFATKDTGAHSVASMDLQVSNGGIDLYSSAVKQLQRMTYKHPELLELVRYPLGFVFRPPFYGAVTVKKELLAQMVTK